MRTVAQLTRLTYEQHQRVKQHLNILNYNRSNVKTRLTQIRKVEEWQEMH